MPASHGCVRLLAVDAEWLYQWGEGWTPAAGTSEEARPGTLALLVGGYDSASPQPRRQLLMPQSKANGACLRCRDFPHFGAGSRTPERNSERGLTGAVNPREFELSHAVPEMLTSLRPASPYTPTKSRRIHRRMSPPLVRGSGFQMTLPGYSLRPLRVMTKPGSVSMA